MAATAATMIRPGWCWTLRNNVRNKTQKQKSPENQGLFFDRPGNDRSVIHVGNLVEVSGHYGSHTQTIEIIVLKVYYSVNG